MWIRISLIAVWVLTFSLTQVFAHGGATHLMGTVTAVHEQHLEVKTKAGKTVGVQLSAETKYRRSGNKGGAAASADLKVGDRVVIEAAMEGETLVAQNIRFSSVGRGKDHERMPHHMRMERGDEER
jgi:preprotein translocase subunit YajC